MDLITIITIIGVVQGLFLSLNLLVTRSKKTFTLSKFFLGLLIFFLCLHCIDSLLTHTKLFYDYPHFFAVKDPFILLYGPLVLLYIQSLITHNFKLRWVHILHLVPFSFFLFRITPLYFRSASYKISVLDQMYENYARVRDVEINLIFNLHIFIYLVVALIVLFKSYKYNRTQQPLLKRKDLKQISIILLVVFIIYTVSMIRFWTSYNANTVLWMPLTIAILFFVIGYKSLQISEVILVESENPNIKGIQRSVEIVKAFDIEMQKSNLYLNPKINLNTIAVLLKTNRQYLSKAINEVKGMSFTNYVNQFRVSKAKELLISQTHTIYSLEKIAKDSGFNSLSTFQRSFKELEGISPSKFRSKK